MHPNYTALTIQFKESRKSSTGKKVYLVCIFLVWFSINLVLGHLSLCCYNAVSKRWENSPQIPYPEMSSDLPYKTRLAWRDQAPGVAAGVLELGV